jgi:dGTPase
MVNDLLETTRANAAGFRSADEVRGAGCAVASFSAALGAEERRLKAFLYEKLYYHPEQRETADRARKVVARLFAASHQQPVLMADGWHDGLPSEEPARSRHIADFIAGMTDRYAMQRYRDVFGEVPEGLSNV